MDKKFLADNYSRMSNEELLFIAANDAKDLSDDAVEVLDKRRKTRRCV